MQSVEFTEGLSPEEVFEALEWGSCDGCGRHDYCAVCGASKSDGKHADSCLVPAVIALVVRHPL
jgi:hypothetical protein